MIQIIRLTYKDDKDASTSIDVMACSSKEAAKEIILNDINKGFDGKWNNLADAAKELDNDLESCNWSEDNNTFSWFDDGKGETYIICELDRGDTKWQNIGEI